MEYIAIGISALSFLFVLFKDTVGMHREKLKDERKETVETTTILVKLENIGTGISDIKADLRNVNEEVRELRDRVIKVEDSVKSAHRRIEEFHISERGGTNNG